MHHTKDKGDQGLGFIIAELRLNAPKNNQIKGIRLAEDYTDPHRLFKVS